MSEKNVKMILSSSILVPDHELAIAIQSEANYPYQSGRLYNPISSLRMLYEPNVTRGISSIIDSFTNLAEDINLRKDFIKQHITCIYYIISLYDDCAILEKYTKDQYGFRISHIDHIEYNANQTPYLYIGERYPKTGMLQNINEYALYMFNNPEDAKFIISINASENDIVKIYKVSTNHLGGPVWAYGDFHDIDKMLYDNIRDQLSKLSGLEYYHYCMQLIEYEVAYFNPVTGHSTDVMWHLNGEKVFRKSQYEFLSPDIYRQMLEWEYPILWHHDGYHE